MKAPAPVSLVGEHVRLDPLRREDAGALLAAAMDGELWRSTVTIVPGSAVEMERYVASALEAQAAGTELPFTISRQSDGRVVGTTRYRCIEPGHRTLEIGSTWISASAQRTPVNTEAKYLLLRHAFEVLDFVRVEFLTDVLNVQSRDAIVRLGAKTEGIRRFHRIMPDGRQRDSICYSIIRPEWPEVGSLLERRLDRTAPLDLARSGD